MGNPTELNAFLASVEKRAFAMALGSVGNPDDALEIVQDVMLKLARKYASRPDDEWPPLFYRMLNNRVKDFHRARSVRSRLFGWLSTQHEHDEDPINMVPAPPDEEPDQRLNQQAVASRLVDAINGLPDRQRQAFTLRAWEGMDVATAARTMGCSAGSVKTHYSRAIAALRTRLEDNPDE